MLAQAQKYLVGEVPAGGFSDVVWMLVDDKLVATDVPALVYPVELAKAFSCAAGAVLDLGEHWGSIVQAELQGRVLPSEPPTGRPG